MRGGEEWETAVSECGSKSGGGRLLCWSAAPRAKWNFSSSSVLLKGKLLTFI